MGQGWVRRFEDLRGHPVAPERRGLVLFDMDGTLHDGAALISETLADAFLAAGEEPPSEAAVRSVIGLSIVEMTMALAPHLPRDRHDKIINGYRLRYFDLAESDEIPPVYRGASQALSRLGESGFTLGLVTGKARRSVSHILCAMNWTRHFRTVQCADANPSKPSKVMVSRALLETGHSARDTILVGDSRYDMQMALAAGVTPVGVSWGYTAPAVLRAEGAVAVARDFDHLVEILARLDAERFVTA
jgi:phosphoglycolate phosphatase